MKLPTLTAACAAATLMVGVAVATTPRPADPPGEVPAMQARLATQASLVAVAQAGDALVAVGDYGTVIRSTDGGRHWSQAQRVPVSTLLTGVSFIDAQHGWAVGHGGVILATTDGGDSWRLQHVAEQKPVLLGVHFSNATTGYAVGAYGTALRTADGGQTWTPMTVGEGRDADLHLNHLFQGPDGSLFAAGEGGAAFRSRDGGEHWTRLDTGVSGSLWSGLARQDGRIVLLGMSGRVLESADGGTHWKVLESGTSQSLTGGLETPDGALLLVGSGGTVVQGQGDTLRTRIRDDRQNLAAVALAGGQRILLGQSGLISDTPTP